MASTWGLPAGAAELALLAGYQLDSDLAISTAEQWPANTLPRGNPGETIDMEDGASWSLVFNTPYRNRNNQRIGLYVSRHNTAIGENAGLADPSLDITFLHFTGTNFYPQSDRFAWFVTAGLGAAFYDPDDATLRDVTRFSAQIGGGANFQLAQGLFLQADVRWLPTFFNSNTAIFCSGGCTVSVDSESYNQVQGNIGVMFRF